MMNTLVLLRHGKSAYPKGVEDFYRPLAPRGLRQAPKSGLWIQKHVGVFDLILCSPAERTRETLQVAKLKGPVIFLDALYERYYHDYIDVLRTLDGNAHKVAIIGHHPAITTTALKLTKNRDSEAAKALSKKFVTSGVAKLVGEIPWNQLVKDSMKLESFFAPPHH